MLNANDLGHMKNKNAFQNDAYRPLIDRISSYPMHPPGNHACPPLQPRMPPPAAMHAPHNHAHPPTTMHGPYHPTTHAPCNHACPPATTHAPQQPRTPPTQPCMPPHPHNHACPPATTHAPPWTE